MYRTIEQLQTLLIKNGSSFTRGVTNILLGLLPLGCWNDIRSTFASLTKVIEVEYNLLFQGWSVALKLGVHQDHFSLCVVMDVTYFPQVEF